VAGRSYPYTGTREACLVTDPSFLRRFRAHHLTAPLLGFIASSVTTAFSILQGAATLGALGALLHHTWPPPSLSPSYRASLPCSPSHAPPSSSPTGSSRTSVRRRPRRNQSDQIPTPRRQSPPPMAARHAPHVISLHDSTPPLLCHTSGLTAAATSTALTWDEASSLVALVHHLTVTAIEGCLVTQDEDIQEPLGAHYGAHQREGVDDV
jgi:hypothetical protein